MLRWRLCSSNRIWGSSILRKSALDDGSEVVTCAGSALRPAWIDSLTSDSLATSPFTFFSSNNHATGRISIFFDSSSRLSGFFISLYLIKSVACVINWSARPRRCSRRRAACSSLSVKWLAARESMFASVLNSEIFSLICKRWKYKVAMCPTNLVVYVL